MNADEDISPKSENLPSEVADAISAASLASQLPPHSLGLYARWWQLETWLRSLVYVELRANYGINWGDRIDGRSKARQDKDGSYEYMSSPDWKDPLAYIDAGILFQMIQDNWSIFEQTLPSWLNKKGKTEEILSIRHRIGHLRRPHEDDLKRLEQALRDFERGAFRAVTSYNRQLDIRTLNKNDSIVRSIKEDNLPGAQELIYHSEQRKEINIRFSFTARPWANFPGNGDSIVGKPGYLWNIGFYPHDRWFKIDRLWHELSPRTRELLVHMLAPDARTISFTFPTVDNSSLVEEAIADVLSSALSSARPIRAGIINSDSDPWSLTGIPDLDSRVQLGTTWSFVTADMIPICLFGAGGGTSSPV